MKRMLQRMAAVVTMLITLPMLSNAQTRFEDNYYTYEVISESPAQVKVIGFSTKFNDFSDESGSIQLEKWGGSYTDTEYDGVNYQIKQIGNRAFSPDNPLYVSRPEAQEMCRNIASFSIQWSVITYIGDQAFMGCSRLTDLSLSNGAWPRQPVTYIGEHAFDGTNVYRVYWNDDVKTIPAYCFANTPNLKEFDFYEATAIGEGAFQNSGFEHLEFPSTMKYIDSKAFDGCSQLKGFKCNDDDPQDIAADAFEGIPADVVLIVPKGSEDLYRARTGWYVFGSRTQSFSMVGKTASNEYFTFEIYQDDTETENGKCTITGLSPECETSTFFDWQIGGCGVWVYDPAGGGHYYDATRIASRAFRNTDIYRMELNGSSIKFIDPQAFAGCESLNYISLPESLMEIGEKAFEGCTNLTRIDLPDNVYFLGKRAFAESGLKDICLTPSISDINEELFAGCPNLTDVVIPSSVMYIGTGAFEESGIQSVVLPISINNDIGDFAFADCKNLKRVIALCEDPYGDIPLSAFKGVAEDAILFVPVGAFDNYDGLPGWTTYLQLCELTDRSGTLFEDGDYKYYVYSFNGVDSDYRNVGLMGVAKGKNPTEVVVPDKVIYDGMDYNVLYVGEEAFQNNGNITRADFSACKKLNTIYGYAFSGCANLKEVTLPESLEQILEGAFKQSGVEEIHIPQQVFDIGDYAFRDCVGLKTLGLSMYPSCDIGEEAFMNTTALENLNLPYSTMLTIFDRAFSNSGIKKLDIPYCIDTDLWGEQVFKDCPNLKNVCSHIYDIYPPKALPYNNIFEGVADKATLWVPEGFVDTYKALDGWKDFSEIKEDLPIPTGIEDVNQETLTNNRYYDMQGRLVENPTKGLYITNGRKVIVK